MERKLAELIEHQKERTLKVAKRIVPGVTFDDLWQPNDFIELESHPGFRYEEGILHGLLMVQASIRKQ